MKYIIEMHKVAAFDHDVSSYPAIIVIVNEKQDTTVIAWADNDTQLFHPTVITTKLRELMSNTIATHIVEDGLRAYKSHQWFKPRTPWAIIEPGKLEILQLLEQRFPSIEETGVHVGIGVASGLDKVYLTTDTSLVEKDRLLPLARTNDIVSGVLHWSNTYLVNPWQEHGLVQLNHYPRLAEYFQKHQGELMQRNVAKNNKNAWYRTIVDLSLLKKCKLYIPDIKNAIHAVLDQGTTYPHHNLYYVSSSTWDLEVLGAILISNIGKFFVESYGVRMRGGYLRMQAQYLRRIRLPLFSTLTLTQRTELKDAFQKRDI
ncbi:hypothetical protein HC891_13125 [Candidatus Gracilibacteria bacterium]|nr:hypothetical protein [Candidatus Gracilibacteria bacterium]